jgi:hypothetical protein
MTSVVALTELLELNTGGSAISVNNPLPVAPVNITGKFRESFENFTPGVNWLLTTGTGDIVQTDGNAVSASYLVISKNPLTANTETSLTYNGSFPMPIETAVGLSMSQRTLGQELSMELVSTEAPTPPVPDIAISSIVQATTTLTVTTAAAHGLVPGKRIGIRGITSDSRFNYPSVVVATTPSLTTFTVTAGPVGTITSVTAGPYTNQGFVYFRSALGYAQNGMSEIFENASATNASAYVRSAAGDVLPSGTASGNQSLTVASTASVQAIASAYTYSFLPTSEYRFILKSDMAQALDVSVDSSTALPGSRQLRTQVIPDPSKDYTLRFRFTNNDSLPVPNGKIVSAAKSGTTTTTITTETAHGLTTGDWVNVYGIGNSTDFPNVTTAVQVLSTPTTTTFTMIIAGAVTATSAGGLVARQQGSLGIQGTQTTVPAQASSTATQLTLIGNGSWTLVIGDYVNVYGLRNRSTGADLGFDGVYKVVDQVTSTLTLEPLTGTTLPSPLTLINTGGAVIKRTDARISFVRIYEYLRERVEVQPNGAIAASVPVQVNGGNISVSGSGVIPQSNNSYALQSSTNLAAGATFTGTAQNIAATTTSSTVYITQLVIGVNHTAGLVPGQLYLDLGTETTSTAPTVWYQALAVAIPSNANWQQFSVPISTRYYRLRFINGATAQTNFRLSSFLTYNGGALSNPYSYPVNIQYQLSATALAANATFTSVTLDYGDTMNIYQTITALAFSDQASASNGFKIQISRDGTNWRDAVSASVTANTLSVITVHLSYRYARVVYTNGATLQGSFNLDAHVDAG